jgi:hypothetical protein
MTVQNPMAGTPWEELPKAATLDDLLPVVERIAAALEAQVRPNTCDEKHATGAKCVLDDRHVGHHVTGDGRYHWLDDE